MSTTKNPTHKKVLESARKAKPLQPQSEIPGYMRKLSQIPDRALASELALEQAGLEFDVKDGKDIPRYELDCKENETAFTASKKILDKLEGQLANTKRLIKSPSTNASIPFAKMDRRDQCSIVLLATCLCTMLIMGAANTYSNIMGSGEPVFLEAPWLAWCLSALVPIGSVAFKYVSNFFDHASSKKRYAIFIFILTTFAIIAWAVMFAQNFNGIAGGMDWDSLGSSDGGKGSLMVFLQIAAEILISAALFLAIEDISIKYNPDILKNNPDHTEFSAALKKHKAEHEATGKKRNTDHTAFVLLKNQRQQHLNMRSTEFAALILSRPL